MSNQVGDNFSEKLNFTDISPLKHEYILSTYLRNLDGECQFAQLLYSNWFFKMDHNFPCYPHKKVPFRALKDVEVMTAQF